MTKHFFLLDFQESFHESFKLTMQTLIAAPVASPLSMIRLELFYETLHPPPNNSSLLVPI
jgi:hypothetical protein